MADGVRSIGSGPRQTDNDIVIAGSCGLAKMATENPFGEGTGWHVLYESAEKHHPDPWLESPELRNESGLLSGDDRVRVNEPDRFPFSTICALRMLDESGRLWGGTGTLVGRNTVLTAGHNVFDRAKNPRRGWFQNVHVIPGLNGSLAVTPFPSAQSNSYRTTDLWADRASDEWDIGAILVPAALGDFAGWMAVAKLTQGTLDGLAIHIPGYPTNCPGTAAQCGPPGTTMWVDSGNVVHVEAQFVRYNINTSAGVSGAPGIGAFPSESPANAHRLVCVHTEGYDPRTNRGVRISEPVLALIQQWLKESQGA